MTGGGTSNAFDPTTSSYHQADAPATETGDTSFLEPAAGPAETHDTRSGRPPRRRRWRWWVAFTVLAGFAAWTAAAYTYGVSTGERRRLSPPAPPPEVVVDVVVPAAVDTLPAAAPDVTVPVVRMPGVIGLSFDEALNVVGSVGLDPSTVVRVDVTLAGTPEVVTAQEPPSGTSDPGTVTLTVSVPADTPNLVGTSLDDARAQLAALGAEAVVRTDYQVGAAPGTVLSMDPSTGPLPERVNVVVAIAGTKILLAELSPVDTDGSVGGRVEDVSINGEELTAFAYTRVYSTRADQTAHVSSLDYLLGRSADLLTFTVGLDDASDPAAAAVVRFYGDGVLLDEEAVTYGQSFPMSLTVSGVLRLRFEVTSTVTGESSEELGRVMFADGTLTGDPATLPELIEP